MHCLITGMNGTLAPVVATAAGARGVRVTAWDRSRVDPENASASDAFLNAEPVDAILHLATGGVPWTRRLAEFAGRRELPFVFTSSAMVFHHEPAGPHRPGDERTARDDYGRYKIECEDAVLRAHAGAAIVRIGWQIDPDRPGNNMLRALDEWQARDGFIGASRDWIPACSFMRHTAEAIVELALRPRAGVHHLDSNAVEAHAFPAIVSALRRRFEREHWIIREHDEYRHDQRLLGDSLPVPPLSSELPELARA